jgi:hypothetical protein
VIKEHALECVDIKDGGKDRKGDLYMKKKRFFAGMSAAVLAFVLVLAACGGGSHPSALVGRWENEDQRGNYLLTMDLLKDGTYATSGYFGGSGTWKTESGRLYLMGWGSETFTYKKVREFLVLTRSDGVVQAFRKQ